jgi:hypothetical protein
MKSKLVLVTIVGILGLAATVPSAIAGTQVGRPSAVSKNSTTKSISVKKVPRKAAVPSHTILPGAKNN